MTIRTAVATLFVCAQFTIAILAQDSGTNPQLPRDSRMEQDFSRATDNYRQSPYDSREFYAGKVSRTTPYGQEFYGRVLNTAANAFEYGPRGDLTFTTNPDRISGYPLPVEVDRYFSDRILDAGLRGVILLALTFFGALLAPKRIWNEILNGRNVAVSIVVAATILALGIVISLR